MNNLKFLEFQRLIKELQFVESDYIYRQEMLNHADQFFQESVNKILLDYPELNSLWSEKDTKSGESEQIEKEVEEKLELVEEDLNLKKLYRDIVKVTHPDKVKNQKLNELYLEATTAYESGDPVTIYKVCSDLMINIEFEEEVIEKIQNKIKDLKKQILFLESTFTFQWIKSDDENRNNIILKYIENRIT
jgi:hypothetical protein